MKLLMNTSIKFIDFTVIDGHRTQEEQDAFFESGASQVMWPNSKHNQTPAMAVDIAPWPIDWTDSNRFYFFAGVIMMLAWIFQRFGMIKHEVRWGGDWDRDTQVNDQSFMDLGHFELVNP